MCGILGYIGRVDSGSFVNSLNTLAHRGPDGHGVWTNDEVTFGHRRLSILDISERAKQPMEIRDRYVITYNGEIYNYIELRKELEKKGIIFKSQSDTEVLLNLYAEEGAACLNKLNGMWALAIYDKQEKNLFVARDRMGKKPLFYTQKGDDFIFASEMKALYPFLDAVTPNTELINRAKTNVFCYETTEECLIRSIKRFPAASYGIYKNNSIDIKTYWKPLDNLMTVPKKYEHQVEMFRELFIDSCKLRMRSDVPIGTALSGGIDSSATISTMSHIARFEQGEYNRDWQHAFVASFPNTSIDETAEAKEVANSLGIKATYLKIDPLKDIDKLFYYSYLFEELYLTSPIPFIQLYNKIKVKGTTVTLDGHGSDELFGGYMFDINHKLWDDYPNYFKMRETLSVIKNGQYDVNNNHDSKRARDYFISYSKQLLRNKKYENISEGNIESLDNLNNRLYASTFKTILPTLLRNYDRYSMINSVEIRMPFLDHRIVSFAFSIKSSSKVRNGYSKAIVRDAMKGFFPERIRLLKRKIGFNSPFTTWIKNDLKEWLLDEMSSTCFKQSEFINSQSVSEFITNVMNNEKANFADGEYAWTLLMPYIWEQSLKYAIK